MAKVKHEVIDKRNISNKEDDFISLMTSGQLIAWAEDESYIVIGRYGTNKSELRKYLPKEK